MRNEELLFVLRAAKVYYDENLHLCGYAFMCSAVRIAQNRGDITTRQAQQAIVWIRKRIKNFPTLSVYLYRLDGAVPSDFECQQFWEKVIEGLEYEVDIQNRISNQD